MEKIGIKYRIPSLVFDEAPLSQQVYSVSYRKLDEEVYTDVAGNYVASTAGRNTNNVEIAGLEEDTDYIVRLTNKKDNSFFESQIHTALNIATGESPIYLKQLFPGQSFQWFIKGLASLYIPTNTGGWFFDLAAKFADTYEGFGPMEAPDGKSWPVRSSYDNDEEAYTCFNVGEGRILRFCTEHANEDARIYADAFGSSSTMYGKFYLDADAANAVVLYVSGQNASTRTIDTFKIGVDLATMLPYASFNTTVNNFDNPVEFSKWYTFAYKPGTGVTLYDSEGAIVSSVTFTFISNPFTDPDNYSQVPIYLGMPDGTTTGVNFAKMWFDPHSNGTAVDRTKVIQSYKFIATVIFERNSGDGVIFTPGTYVRLGDQAAKLYTAPLDRNPFDVVVTCDVSGIDESNPVSMRVNGYLYQYNESTTFQTKTDVKELVNGEAQRLTFTIDNTFAYAGRFDVDTILVSGTTDQAATVKITALEINGVAVPVTSLFKSGGALVVSDSNNGDALAYIRVTDVSGAVQVAIPALSSGGGVVSEKFVTPLKWISKISDSGIMITIDPTLPVGKWRMSCKAELSVTFAEMDIEVVSVAGNLSGAFDINFNEDFDAALAEFKTRFSGYHSQWGGYNGGCNSNLIYADRLKKTLVFEQHGDAYKGQVDGVAKPAKDSSFNGYGTVAYCTAPNDPNVGEIMRTRVGSVAVSNEYLGYGQVDTWVNIPEGTYGICMALWLFHYIEVYPNDERWDYWISRGGKPYGGADPYMVINNEIDIELPSHNVNGVFASWSELLSAYFDPLALDAQYKVGVEGDGTYLYDGTGNPNQRSSWTKVSSTIMQRNFPYFKAMKFNNWVGEKSSGNGWAYTKADYEGEEYLALLTDLAKNLADGQSHKYTIKWFKDHSELWVDDVYIRTNRAFVPFNVSRWTIGGWFPSPKEEKYTPETPGTWAGENADFDILHFGIDRIKYTPFTEVEAGGVAEFSSESYPEAGLRELL